MKETPIIPLLQLDNITVSFSIETIQHLLDNADDKQHTFHNHNHYELVWLHKGTGILYADLCEYKIEDDSIFCIRPNQAHKFQLGAGMEGFVFSFTDSFFNIAEQDLDGAHHFSIFQVFCQSIPIRPEGDSLFAIKEVVALMIKEYENQSSLRMELLKRYFRIFLIYLSRHAEAALNVILQTREAGLVKAFVELLDKNFKKNKMVSYYAENLYISPNYLNRVIKVNTGFSASHHIKQRVLLEAKRLGRYSDAGMKQIAYSLGFSDSAHFSKFFKSGSGTNFSDFKNAVIIPQSFNRA